MEEGYRIQIFYEDTDAGGIVYHANYVKFMERARTVLFQQKGLSLTALIEEYGAYFVVRAIQVNYKQPVKLEETIVIKTHVTKLRRASMTLLQTIYKEHPVERQVVCTGIIDLVCTNSQFQPCPLPSVVLASFKREIA